MRYIVIYDIPDDRIRMKVADICLDYGLDRVQYSAFLGRLTRGQQREMVKKIRRRLGKHEGKVLVLPISADAWRERVEIVQEEEG